MLLVAAILVLLIVSALAEGQGKGQGKDKSLQAQEKGKARGLQVKENKTVREKLKGIAEELNCSSGTVDEKGRCRAERQKEIRQMIGNCTNDTNCVVEARRERWQRRLEELAQRCSENDTSACRRQLNTVKECLNETPGPDRAECARNKLRLGKIVSQLVRECRNDTNQTNQSNCIENVQESVYVYATIKLQDLADRAEMLIGMGVNVSIVDDFVALIEESIIAFGESETIAEKKDVILGVRHAWLGLIQEAKNQL